MLRLTRTIEAVFYLTHGRSRQRHRCHDVVPDRSVVCEATDPGGRLPWHDGAAPRPVGADRAGAAAPLAVDTVAARLADPARLWPVARRDELRVLHGAANAPT